MFTEAEKRGKDNLGRGNSIKPWRYDTAQGI